MTVKQLARLCAICITGVMYAVMAEVMWRSGMPILSLFCIAGLCWCAWWGAKEVTNVL